MKKTLLVLASAVLASGGIWLASAVRAPQVASSPAESTPPRSPSVVPPTTPSLAAITAPPSLPSPASMEAAERPSTAPVQAVDVREHLERAYQDQRLDGAASADVQRLQREVPSLLPPGSALRSVSCGQDLCRVETSHLTEGSYQAFLDRAFVPGVGALGHADGFFDASRAEPEQPLVAVAYLARAGKTLPSPEPVAGP